MPDDRLAELSRLLDVATLRQRVHAGNLANQNTPGYKARAVEFDAAFREALDHGGTDAALRVDPQVVTPLDTPAQADGNDVSLDDEVAAMAKNQELYNAYVQMARGQLRLLNTAISAAPGG